MAVKILHNAYFKLRENKQAYGNTLPKFALGNRNRDTVKAISRFSRCRETLNSFLKHKINTNTANTKVLKLLMWFVIPETIIMRKNNDKSVYRALDVLNIIEKELKWKKTTIKKVDHKLGCRHNLYIVTASPKWMLSPPLLSLYMLILRSYTFKNISKVKSITGLATACTKTTSRDIDTELLRKIAPILKKFLVNINEIYKGRNQKTNFENTAFDEGITKLVIGKTNDKLVLERFLKYTRK